MSTTAWTNLFTSTTAVAVPLQKLKGASSWALNFLYRGIYYRMCYEPAENEGEPRFYYVYVMHCESRGYPTADKFEVIGRYEKFQDLLNKFFIGGVPFKDVIMDDNTEILSQD